MPYGPNSTSRFLGSSSGTRPASPGVLPERSVPPGMSIRSRARGATLGRCAAASALAAALAAAGTAFDTRLLGQPVTTAMSTSRTPQKTMGLGTGDTPLAFPLDGRQTQPQMLFGEARR
jgi:hypothetical protein